MTVLLFDISGTEKSNRCQWYQNLAQAGSTARDAGGVRITEIVASCYQCPQSWWCEHGHRTQEICKYCTADIAPLPLLLPVSHTNTLMETTGQKIKSESSDKTCILIENPGMKITPPPRQIIYSVPSPVPSSEFGTYHLCEQRRFRRACASVQSRQKLRYSLIQAVSQEEPSDRKPDP